MFFVAKGTKWEQQGWFWEEGNNNNSVGACGRAGSGVPLRGELSGWTAKPDFQGFSSQNFPTCGLQRWKISLHPDSPRVTNSCHCGTQSTDKPQQLLMLIPTEPSSIESSASLLIQKPLSAALHPQPCTPHNSAYFTFISSNYKALLTRMTDFITHYYTISVFSNPNKKKVQKKILPLITNDLIFRNNFDAKTQLLLNLPVWFKLFPCLTPNKCHMK